MTQPENPRQASFLADSERKERPTHVMFHHGIRSQHVRYETISAYPSPIGYPHTRISYEWLAKHLGFEPINLAVGDTQEALNITGYSRSKDTLFSFSDGDVPGRIFMDHDEWDKELWRWEKTYDVEAIFHPSWTLEDWQRRMQESPGSVAILVPSLDLTKASSIHVTNDLAKERLENAGFISPGIAPLLEDVEQILSQRRK